MVEIMVYTADETTDCRVETQQLSHQSISHTSDTKLISHGNCGHNNYVDAYFPSSWDDVALEVAVSSVKSMDVTCKTYSS